MSVHFSHFITVYSLLYASLPPNIKPTYQYFFKQHDDLLWDANQHWKRGEHGKHYHKLDDYGSSEKLFWPVEIPFSLA